MPSDPAAPASSPTPVPSPSPSPSQPSRPPVPVNADIVAGVKQQLAFQRKWQRISATAHVGSTIAILLLTAGATLTAATASLQGYAAYLSAAATVLIGLEKSLLFREKWKFHLGVATRLAVLQAKIEAGALDGDQAVDEYTDILNAYATSLPMDDGAGQ